LLEETQTSDLEEAYVALTDDDSRVDSAEEEGKLARAWRRMLTRGGA